MYRPPKVRPKNLNFWRSFCMTKYSLEFKMNIVQDYLNGEGVTPYLAKKYGVKGNSQVRNWINAYKEFFKEGLLHSYRNKTYSVQFKLDAIELYLTPEMSYREVANLKCLKKNKLPASDSSKKELTYLEELEKETRRLKIELAYLKELRRLRLREQQNNKHESFIISEKISD